MKCAMRMRWVKFEFFLSCENLLGVPAGWGVASRELSVRFGGAPPLRAAIRPEPCGDEAGNSFAHPDVVRVSSALRRSLMLPEGLVCRALLSAGGEEIPELRIGPVIGLLLGVHTNRYTPEHMRKYSDRLGVYGQVGGLVCAFSPKSVDWERRTAWGLYYDFCAGEWKYAGFPLPDVIYRRDFHCDPRTVGRLSQCVGGRLFNSWRFDKMQLYDYLSGDARLGAFLPQTERCENFPHLCRFLERFPRAILKPVDLSRGRGICVIESGSGKNDGEPAGTYRITDYRPRRPSVSLFSDKAALAAFFDANPDLFRGYLVQRYLDLARIGPSPFDIRVVMQKRPGSVWACSGIECRESAGGSHLTNISRGGSALTLEEALRASFGAAQEECEAMREKVIAFCEEFCRKMDRFGGHFAEFGVDIALDTARGIWLIEANVFPSFKGFRRTDPRTYRRIRYTPLLYALSLTAFGRRGSQDVVLRPEE